MKKILLITLLLFQFHSVHAKKDEFKNYADQIKALRTIYVVTDTTIVENVEKKKFGLHLPYNQQVGIEMFANIKDFLGKGINSNFIHALSSVGLYEKENVFIYDAEDISNHIVFPVLDKNINYPMLANFKASLDYIVDRTHAWPRTRKEFKKYRSRMLKENFSGVKNLNLTENEAVLVFITAGSKVPTKKSVGEAVASTVLTLGLFTRYSISANQLNAALISHDGELLWANSYFRGGKVTKDKKQESFLRSLFKTFPIKIKKTRS